jgi:hypothetical protein
MSALLATQAFTLTLPMSVPLEIITAISLRLMEPDPVQPATLEPLLEESVKVLTLNVSLTTYMAAFYAPQDSLLDTSEPVCLSFLAVIPTQQTIAAQHASLERYSKLALVSPSLLLIPTALLTAVHNAQPASLQCTLGQIMETARSPTPTVLLTA